MRGCFAAEEIWRYSRIGELDLVAAPFAEHPHVVIAPPDHPLARRRRVEVEALAAETFLVREVGSGTRTAMERFFQERGVPLRVGMEMPSNETIKQAVMAGLGLSFISLHSIALELSSRALAVVHARPRTAALGRGRGEPGSGTLSREVGDRAQEHHREDQHRGQGHSSRRHRGLLGPFESKGHSRRIGDVFQPVDLPVNFLEAFFINCPEIGTAGLRSNFA